MNSKPGQPMRADAGKHPMRAAGEFFGWLWGPSEAERSRRRGIADSGMGQRSIQVPLRQQQVVEQRIEDGRIVLRRITIEEIEIQREMPRGQSQG